jgi:hypothetical protein
MAKLPNKYNLSSMVLIVSENGKVIANCMPLAVPKLACTFEEAAEHAEHLVKAGNAYPEFVGGIKLFLDALKSSIDAEDELTVTEALFYGYFQATLEKLGEMKCTTENKK